MEKMIGIMGMIFSIVLLVVLGIVFIKGRGSDLIAGFNTMSPEKKKQYDTVALTKFIGKIMFASAFSVLFWMLSIAFEISWLNVFGYVLFIGITVFTLVYVYTGNRFKK